MAKKKQNAKQLFKPPQTAHYPPAVTAADPSSSQTKTVNEMLADLRRTNGGTNPGAAAALSMASHERSLPPEVRQILQIPDLPQPRMPYPMPGGSDGGRRGIAGPPPPRSWLVASTRRHGDRWSTVRSPRGSVSGATAASQAHAETCQDPLPGANLPRHGSFADMVLRCMAREWPFQASYNRFHLFALPSRTRTSLIRYVSLWGARGVTVHDLRLILRGPSPEELREYGFEDEGECMVAYNEDMFQLDLCGSAGRSIKIKELADLLFPIRQAILSSAELSESWETAPLPVAPLPALIPNLTHLSLGIMPLQLSPLGTTPREAPSWQELLTHAPKFSALTHLSLAHWPVPSRTQNSTLASVVRPSAGGGDGLPSRSVQYGGTGPYSHSLDDDFSEAVGVMRQLARSLYRLEYLDLTGCGGWCAEALTRADDAGSSVDWRGDWGQLAVLRVGSGEMGREVRSVALAPVADRSLMTAADVARVSAAQRIERHVIGRRAGVGRLITVEIDWEEDALLTAMAGLSM